MIHIYFQFNESTDNIEVNLSYLIHFIFKSGKFFIAAAKIENGQVGIFFSNQIKTICMTACMKWYGNMMVPIHSSFEWYRCLGRHAAAVHHWRTQLFNQVGILFSLNYLISRSTIHFNFDLNSFEFYWAVVICLSSSFWS